MKFDDLTNDILNTDDVVNEKLAQSLATGALAAGLAFGSANAGTPESTRPSLQQRAKPQKKLPRGIRNHNPGNIEAKGNWKAWGGAVDSDGRFIIFDKPEMGIRALGRVLKTYNRNYGINTIDGIVSRWAPPNENDTESYIKSVASSTGLERDKRLDLNDHQTMKRLMKAIITHENGQMPYTEEQLSSAISLIDKNY